MSTTNIEWTKSDDGTPGKVWNPTVGCTRVSEGCRHCYAFTLHDKRHAAHKAGKKLPAQYAKPFKELQLMPDRLEDPLHWRKPARVFVNSVSDLFHDDVPDEFIAEVFSVMARAKQHTFQVLTKRAERMQKLCSHDAIWWGNKAGIQRRADYGKPLPNVWLGVSVEDQARADERIPLLLQTPAAVRFLSCEPLLGPLKIDMKYHCGRCNPLISPGHPVLGAKDETTNDPRIGIGWVIVGGESGAGARPMSPQWARSLRDQCQAAGVPFFFKQHGEWCAFKDLPLDQLGKRELDSFEHQTMDDHSVHRVGKAAAGRLLDGREWSEFPEVPANV